MTPATPPGTVPLIIHWPTMILHTQAEYPDSHYCDRLFCKRIGFRVVDEAAFNAWLEELRWGIDARRMEKETEKR